jgi:hypothetical protein
MVSWPAPRSVLTQKADAGLFDRGLFYRTTRFGAMPEAVDACH